MTNPSIDCPDIAPQGDNNTISGTENPTCRYLNIMTKLPALLTSASLLVAAGCVEKTVVANGYDAQLTHWLNQPQTSLEASWGPPTQKIRLANGGDALVWVTPTADGQGTCSTVLSADNAGILRSYNYAGMGCHAPGQPPM